MSRAIMFTHVNMDLYLGDKDGRHSVEARQLRDAINMANKVNWRKLNRKDQFTPRAKFEFMRMRREANARFQNITIAKHESYGNTH